VMVVVVAAAVAQWHSCRMFEGEMKGGYSLLCVVILCVFELVCSV